MKKILSIMLAFVLMLSMGTVAFAAGDDGEPAEPKYEESDHGTVTIYKNYEVTNPGTISPAETFAFTIEKVSVSDQADGITEENMPVPTVGTVAYTWGDAGNTTKTKEITVQLPDYEGVGIYEYKICETDAGTAGVSYHADDIRLVVYVLQTDSGLIRVPVVRTEKTGEKADSITNTYSAGDLEIKKVVTGNLGDQKQYFEVEVTLSPDPDDKYVTDSDDALTRIYVAGGSYSSNPKSVTVGEAVTFKIRHDETITLKNIPYGVTYTVTEADYTDAGYDDPAYNYVDENGTAKEIDSAKETMTITNNKDANVETGIDLDSLPYILILSVAFVGIAVFLFRRRMTQED